MCLLSVGCDETGTPQDRKSKGVRGRVYVFRMRVVIEA